MDRQSQFYRKKQPQEQVNVPQQQGPELLRDLWEAAKGGWKNPNLTFEQWDWKNQPRRNMQEWLTQNPGKTEADYRRFIQSYPRRNKKKYNWLQRLMIPKSIRNTWNKIR
jgi:hypothetical protein